MNSRLKDFAVHFTYPTHVAIFKVAAYNATDAAEQACQRLDPSAFDRYARNPSRLMVVDDQGAATHWDATMEFNPQFYLEEVKDGTK